MGFGPNEVHGGGGLGDVGEAAGNSADNAGGLGVAAKGGGGGVGEDVGVGATVNLEPETERWRRDDGEGRSSEASNASVDSSGRSGVGGGPSYSRGVDGRVCVGG
jgi:hypothetical protein